MTRFQLVFRQDGENDRSEYRYNDKAGEPHIDGKLIVDGEVYTIRDVEWLMRKDDAGDSMARFVCTLVVEPTDALSRAAFSWRASRSQATLNSSVRRRKVP